MNRIFWDTGPAAQVVEGRKERRNQRLARGSLFAEKRVRACRERQCANQLACRGRLVRDKGGKRYNIMWV